MSLAIGARLKRSSASGETGAPPKKIAIVKAKPVVPKPSSTIIKKAAMVRAKPVPAKASPLPVVETRAPVGVISTIAGVSPSEAAASRIAVVRESLAQIDHLMLESSQAAASRIRGVEESLAEVDCLMLELRGIVGKIRLALSNCHEQVQTLRYAQEDADL